jgi:type II secretion system protein G
MPVLSHRRAFTLIELLIVVAILVVLAAIAVPNFMEAQTRSKVARAKADMRSLATAIEAYAVDWNNYPFTTQDYEPLPQRLSPLTTPVAFITEIPTDPFERDGNSSFGKPGSPEDPAGNTYLYNTGNKLVFLADPDPNALSRRTWSLTSGGPDRSLLFIYWPFADLFIDSGTYVNYIYDPTNGTTSSGEIFLRGGRINRQVSVIDWK